MSDNYTFPSKTRRRYKTNRKTNTKSKTKNNKNSRKINSKDDNKKKTNKKKKSNKKKEIEKKREREREREKTIGKKSQRNKRSQKGYRKISQSYVPTKKNNLKIKSPKKDSIKTYPSPNNKKTKNVTTSLHSIHLTKGNRHNSLKHNKNQKNQNKQGHYQSRNKSHFKTRNRSSPKNPKKKRTNGILKNNKDPQVHKKENLPSKNQRGSSVRQITANKKKKISTTFQKNKSPKKKETQEYTTQNNEDKKSYFDSKAIQVLRSGNLRQIKQKFRSKNVNITEKVTGKGALHFVCSGPKIQPKLINWLIRHGVNVNQRCHLKKTPLHYLCKMPWKVSSMRTLLESGANINAQNFEGNTPLHILLNDIDSDTKDALSLFWNFNAVSDIKNNHDLSAAEISKNNGIKWPPKQMHHNERTSGKKIKKRKKLKSKKSKKKSASYSSLNNLLKNNNQLLSSEKNEKEEESESEEYENDEDKYNSSDINSEEEKKIEEEQQWQESDGGDDDDGDDDDDDDDRYSNNKNDSFGDFNSFNFDNGSNLSKDNSFKFDEESESIQTTNSNSNNYNNLDSSQELLFSDYVNSKNSILLPSMMNEDLIKRQIGNFSNEDLFQKKKSNKMIKKTKLESERETEIETENKKEEEGEEEEENDDQYEDKDGDEDEDEDEDEDDDEEDDDDEDEEEEKKNIKQNKKHLFQRLKTISGFQDIPLKDLEFIKKVGSGSFKRVLEGRWLGNQVAIAQLKQSSRLTKSQLQDFEREVKLLCTLHHPKIVRFYGGCIQNMNKLLLVSEFCGGGDLFQLLHSKKKITRKQKIRIALDTAQGIQYLHSKNLIHRDLKSPNVLLKEFGNNLNAKITDFGLSKTMDASQTFSNNTIVGTPRWMAPELLRAEKNYTNKVDIYAFGIILWEISKREIPFRGINQFQFLMSVGIRGERPEINENDLFYNLIIQCWRQNPKDRPAIFHILKDLKTIE
ncbi:serine/threonine-protein kinase tnni3k-related [Anaeramoeba flamelloides]|uniref:Serine/threonine-protein kinase tnni3k-related n=1 Tax=Anaeramoeba flamelloides TaxID=1746091 RepID=A0ABQ8Z697_9EUKA|nr:serine/threonine-protein kinase tnni3k-related [Anaeramoeba flamelloides]